METETTCGKKMNDQFMQRLDESLRALCEKRAEFKEIDTDSAKILWIEAECVVACLQGFMFCVEFEERLAREKRDAGTEA